MASFPGVKYAPLHYRNIEKVKSEALNTSGGNFEATCTLSTEAIADLTWWKTATLKNWVHPLPISLEIKNDACTGSNNTSGGWGATCDNITCGGEWELREQSYHINTRELPAV